MNLIFIIKVQDGMNRRNQYHTAKMPDNSTIEDIKAKGDEILRENFTGDFEDEWAWDSSYETAGTFYSFKKIPCDESFRIIEEILMS